MSIYVGNLSYQVTEEAINDVFSEYGTVKRVQLPVDRETGRLRGFGFVEMSSEAEEAAAIDALDGAEWMGRDLKVNKARPREERSNSGGGGGWGGRTRQARRF
jgi:RNA recognition motif-containing protein